MIGWAWRPQFDKSGEDVAFGIITNIKKAHVWMGYIYPFIRMRMNPLAYVIGWNEVVVNLDLSSK